MEKAFIETTVLAAAQEVFSMMLGMDSAIRSQAPEEESTDDKERVVALVGLAGNYLGTGMIGCSPKFACKAASVMMMNDYPTVDSEVLDAMGEISNMIFGNVKTAMEEHAGALGLSIPTVVFGSNFSTRSMASQAWVNVPMQVEDEEIDIRFCLTPNSAMNRHVKHGFKREYSLSEV